jgi:pimeloyl-ACP methyl ester carboxylesterase
MSTTAQRLVPTDAPGSVSLAPHLPVGFTDTFTSYLVDTGRVRLRAVAGGGGPPLLLVPGLMEVLGHSRFAVIGHDVGVWIGYALAADHPQRLARLAVAEAAIPGISPVAPDLGSARVNKMTWHFGFNRLKDLNEALVRGREDIFFGWHFANKASTPTAVPDYVVNYYVEALARDRQALHCTFEVYRAIEHTVEQNIRRRNYRLQLPVLAIGGADASDEGVAETMRLIADDVTLAVLEHCGHYVADEAPEGMLAGLEPFPASYEADR